MAKAPWNISMTQKENKNKRVTTAACNGAASWQWDPLRIHPRTYLHGVKYLCNYFHQNYCQGLNTCSDYCCLRSLTNVFFGEAKGAKRFRLFTHHVYAIAGLSANSFVSWSNQHPCSLRPSRCTQFWENRSKRGLLAVLFRKIFHTNAAPRLQQP